MENLAIIIYRNNLRIDDNYPLYHATQNHDKVLALYSLEILEGFTSFGFKKCERFRRKFIYEALIDLRSNLQNYGINLSICDDIKSTLEELCQKYNIKIFFDHEVGVEEENFEKILKSYDYESFFTQTMIEPFVFDYDKSFSHFRKKAEKSKIKEPLLVDKKVTSINFPSIDIKIEEISYENKNSIILKGGEKEAIKRLNTYEEFIHSYKSTRNEMSGLNNSTKLSAYLSIGCISPRRVYYTIKQYEAKTHQSDSSYWIYFELLWRDFFYLLMKYSQNKLFLQKGLQETKYKFKTDKKLLDDFFNANTKVDLIDASIKELKSTGWLSNRNRQLVANYFVKYLGLNWIYGSEFFESFLLDYNSASNYGNWAYQASVGNDKQYRVFHINKQCQMYNGTSYIQKWHKESGLNIDFNKMIEETKKEVFLF